MMPVHAAVGKNIKIVGIDNDVEVLNLTRSNISMNDRDENITVIKGNLDRGIEDFPKLKRQTFHHVFSNPPYYRYNIFEKQTYFSAYHISTKTATDYLNGIINNSVSILLQLGF